MVLGGNYGVVVVYIVCVLGSFVIVYMFLWVYFEKVVMVERWGGYVKIVGDMWDDVYVEVIGYVDDCDLFYIYFFVDDVVMVG